MALKQPLFEVYEAKDGWRWALKSKNGRIIADSGQAYSSKRKTIDSVANVIDTVAQSRVDVVDITSIV